MKKDTDMNHEGSVAGPISVVPKLKPGNLDLEAEAIATTLNYCEPETLSIRKL
jgi:hypothetical protein